MDVGGLGYSGVSPVPAKIPTTDKPAKVEFDWEGFLTQEIFDLEETSKPIADPQQEMLGLLDNELVLLEPTIKTLVEAAGTLSSVNLVGETIDTLDRLYSARSATTTVASGITTINQVSEYIEPISLQLTAVSGAVGSEIGIALELVTLVQQGKELRNIKEQLDKHNNSLKTETSPKTRDWLETQIQSLELRESRITEILFVHILRASTQSVGNATGVSAVLTQLLGASNELVGGLSMASGGLTLVGTSLVLLQGIDSIKDDYASLKRIDIARDTLMAKLQEPDLNPAVVHIINIRLSRLQQLAQDCNFRLLQNGISVGTSIAGSLALTSGMILTLTGTTIGGAVVSTASLGVGAALIGGVVLASGLAYAAHKNRDVIRLSSSQVKTFIEHKYARLQIKQRRAEYSGFEQLISESQRAIRERSVAFSTELKEVQKELDLIEAKIEELCSKPLDGQSGVDLQRHFQNRQQLHQKLNRLEKLGALELEACVDKHGKLIANVNKASASLHAMTKQLTVLEQRRKSLQEEKEVVWLSQNFSEMTKDEIRDVAVALHTLLDNDPNTKEVVRDFLIKQKALDPEYETSPVTSIFRYIVSHV